MNATETDPKAQLSTLLSRFPPGVRALAKRCLTGLRGRFPGAYEIVYDYASSVVVAFSASERGYEAIVALAVLPDAVKLYVDKSLPDPKGLLEGAGSKVRSVTVESATQLDRGDVHDLLVAAIRRSGAAFPKSGATRMVIKSGAKKKAAKAPRKKA